LGAPYVDIWVLLLEPREINVDVTTRGVPSSPA
jgi:hypothetical protein